MKAFSIGVLLWVSMFVLIYAFDCRDHDEILTGVLFLILSLCLSGFAVVLL